MPIWQNPWDAMRELFVRQPFDLLPRAALLVVLNFFYPVVSGGPQWSRKNFLVFLVFPGVFISPLWSALSPLVHISVHPLVR